jgi:phosphatidylserine synthase
MVAVLAMLMTSTIRYPSFKEFNWGRRQPSVTIILIVLLAGAIFYYSEYSLILLAGAYCISGLTMYAVRAIRHRVSSHPAD